MGIFDRFGRKQPPSSHGPDGPVALAARAACDPVFALLPGVWSSASVRVERVSAGALRIDGVTAELKGGGRSPLPELDDKIGWSGAANVGFTLLRRALVENGGSWDGGRVQIERRSDALHVELFDPKSNLAHAIAIGPELARGLLFRSELLEHFRDGATHWAAREAARNERLADLEEWHYFQDRRVMRFTLATGELVEVPVQILGSFSNEAGTWCWSWANPLYQPEEYAEIERLAEHVDRDAGFGALWRPGYPCTERFAAYVCELTADDIGATAVLGLGDDRQKTFFALMA